MGKQVQVGLTGPGPTDRLWRLTDCWIPTFADLLCLYRARLRKCVQRSQHAVIYSKPFRNPPDISRRILPPTPISPLRFLHLSPSTSIRRARLKQRAHPRLSAVAGAAGVSEIMCASTGAQGSQEREAWAVFYRSPRVGWTWMSAHKHSVTTTHVFTVVIIRSWWTDDKYFKE